jgi:hypothetical protein
MPMITRNIGGPAAFGVPSIRNLGRHYHDGGFGNDVPPHGQSRVLVAPQAPSSLKWVASLARMSAVV